MSGKILTIDIRDETLTALLLLSGLKGNRVESHCHVQLNQAPPDIENRIFWALSRVTEELDTQGATCILSIPPGEVTYRNVTVPFKERRKIAQLLPLELESGLPCAVEDLTIDFDIVRKSDYTDIIAAAVKTETVGKTVEILKSFDITTRYITTGPVAEAMCLVRPGAAARESDFLFISIDDSCATACMVFSGKLHLARTFKLPRTGAGSRNGRVKKEIARVIASFETIYDFDCRFDRIMVSNAASGAVDDDMPALIALLNDVFEADAGLVDMFVDGGLKMLSAPDVESREKRLYNSALGLSGIEIGGIAPFNFSSEHYFLHKYWMDNKREFIVTGALVAFVFLMIMINTVVHARFLENQVQKRDDEIVDIFRSTFPDETRIVDPLHQMRAEINQVRQDSALAQNPRANIPNIDILNAISTLIPDEIDVLITNMVRSDDHVTISGTIDTFNAVDDVKGRLERSDLFENITISAANMDSSINRIRFRIRLDLAGGAAG